MTYPVAQPPDPLRPEGRPVAAAPPPATGHTDAAREPRPQVVTLGGFAMFAVGLSALLLAMVDVLDASQLFSNPHLPSVFISLVFNLLIAGTAFTGGVMALAGRSGGRMVGVAAAGAAAYAGCSGVTRGTANAIQLDVGMNIVTVVAFLLMVGMFVVAVASIVMLATGRANAWFAARARTTASPTSPGVQPPPANVAPGPPPGPPGQAPPPSPPPAGPGDLPPRGDG